MSKIFFLILFLSLSSTSNASPTSEGNFDNLRYLLQSFMDSYTGSSFNMTNCLSSSSQSDLNEYLAASVGYMLIRDWSHMFNMYESFLLQLSADCNACGLSLLGQSFSSGLDSKGKVWYKVNALANSKELLALAEQFSKELADKQFIQAGSTLGQITQILIPYEEKTNSLALGTPAYQNFWIGFIGSVSVNPKKIGPCAMFMLNAVNASNNATNDIAQLVRGEWSGMRYLFGDLAMALTPIESYTGICYFSILRANFDEIFEIGGLGLIISRYTTRAVALNTAYTMIADCSANYMTCGQAIGTVVKYLLGWSIN